MFERAPGINFSISVLCRCAAAQFQMIIMTRRAYSRIGYRVIRGRSELVASKKVNDKFTARAHIFDHSSES